MVLRAWELFKKGCRMKGIITELENSKRATNIQGQQEERRRKGRSNS